MLACTRQKGDGSQVHIQFPAMNGVQQAAGQFFQSLSPLSFDSTAPSALSDIDCYGVFVGASESGFNESSCTSGNGTELFRFGPSAGLFPAGSTATLEVRSGSNRGIYVAGVKMLSGSCQGPVLKNITASNYSYPYLLASVVRNLPPGDVPIDLTLQADFSAAKKMASCSFFSGSPAAQPPILQIASAYQHTCALSNDGNVKCWGHNGYGQLGLGDLDDRGDGAGEMGNNLPYVDIDGTAVQIAVGAYHSCARMNTGQVKCWGYNFAGQLGIGNTTDIGDGASEMGPNLQAVDLGTGRTAVSISAGNYSTCALLDNSTVKCWGLNDYGQLGLGDTNNRGDAPGEMGDSLPALNFGGATPTAVFGGVANNCAIMSTGALKCWGDGSNGAVGDSTAGTARTSPTQVTGLTANVVNVEIGYLSSCAVLSTGAVNCWGMNGFGQLGDGTTTDRNAPVAVSGLTDAVKVGLGNDHACAIRSDGTLKCWGSNGNGGLGIDSSSSQSSPVSVLNISGVTGITGGNYHTCAILSGSSVKCWGGNSYGELGLGDTAPRGNTPGDMATLPAVDLGN
jgi:alpha-tubulin suppressor-like RCC1 family protein